MPKPILEIKDLKVYFGGGGFIKKAPLVKAVDGLNLTVYENETFGLVGESGCGKSTVLYMISGLKDPTDGQVFFDDEDVTFLEPNKRGIGFVFQNYALFTNMTVYENVFYALKINKVPKKEAPFPQISRMPKYSPDFSAGMIRAK